MSNVLCIIGSPHANGSTAALVQAVTDGLADADSKVITRVLGDMNIHFCKGCRECEKTRRCAQRDDMDILASDIMEAEVMILASPTYWGDVTAQTKTFIDRSLPLCNARTGQTPVPPGKLGVAIAIRAGKSYAECRHVVDTISHYFGHLGIELAGSITAQGIDCPEDLHTQAEVLDECYELGQLVAARLRNL